MKTLLLFLHGSGSSGTELMQLLNSVLFTAKLSTHDVFLSTPTAKCIPYAPFDNEYVNCWFNRSEEFLNLGVNDAFEDVDGIMASVEQLESELIEQIAKFSYDNFIIAGFSMGGGMALHLASYILGQNSSLSHKLLGVTTIGSFLVNSSIVYQTPAAHIPISHSVPLRMMHDNQDETIFLQWGKETFEKVSSLACFANASFRAYDMDSDYHHILHKAMVS